MAAPRRADLQCAQNNRHGYECRIKEHSIDKEVVEKNSWNKQPGGDRVLEAGCQEADENKRSDYTIFKKQLYPGDTMSAMPSITGKKIFCSWAISKKQCLQRCRIEVVGCQPERRDEPRKTALVSIVKLVNTPEEYGQVDDS